MDKAHDKPYEKMREFIFMRGKESKILEKLQQKRTIQFMNYFDENGNTALHYAVSQKYEKVIQIYFQYAKDRNLWKSEKSSVSLEAIRFSIKVWVNFENSDGMTALHYASLKGNTSIAQILENEGAKADKVTKTGLTMLHIAVQQNSLISFIHFRGKVDLNATDNNQSTVLHWAVYKGYERIVEYILSENKFQHTFKDINGQTALHLAALYNKSKIVEILLRNGANRMVKDKENKYPVELTEDKQIIDMIELKNGCFKSQYVYQPKQRDEFYLLKFVVAIGVLLAISLFNFYSNRTNNIKFQPVGSENSNGFASLWVLILENVVLFCGIFLLLFLCYKKNKTAKMDISELKFHREVREVIEFYCFNCRINRYNEQNIYEKDYYLHCDICNQCFEQPFKHSLLCNRCIGKKDVPKYTVSIFAFVIFGILQIIHGVTLIGELIDTKKDSNDYEKWKIVVVIGNLIPCVFLAFCIRELYKIVKFVVKRNNKKLTESSFGLNSTLFVQKFNQNMKLRKESVVSNQ